MRVFKFSLPLHGFSGRQSPAQGSAPFPRKESIFTVDVVTFSGFVFPVSLRVPVCTHVCLIVFFYFHLCNVSNEYPKGAS